ncbi:putative short-chain dehydrogenase/reductase family protein [Lentithecium fluviatile CBS 122367]|uniref:Putative short-chain dehydrogenase/reductase family protein n=1 Tax=Lentithecium fluviatile CBS 122367 TaxID=1168545 RepID=A0A6G1J2A4_9PLEO|nr:putative short-chain dehydrogenase/reductase family protein [Lentithecium fluviatile CBS 122367]
MTASQDLPPFSGSTLRLFLNSQFCAKPQPPPPSTSFAGHSALITGSNIGIGLECCRQFLKLGCTHLIMAVRNAERGETAASPLRKTYPTARIEVWTLDMSSYPSIQSFAQRCSKELSRLDIAILNAGMTQLDFKRNESTSHEEIFQVNYLSTALLAFLLLPALAKGRKQAKDLSPSRLTIVSSGTALISTFPNHAANPLIPSFDKSQGWNLAAANERYSVTKTLLLMFVLKLSTVVPSATTIVNTVDPGLVGGSGLHRNMKGAVKAVLGAMKIATARSLEHGAWTYVDAAVVKGAESHGSFLMDWKIAPFHALMYTDEGRETVERLWTETLEEFRFAGVEDVLGAVE